MSVKLDNIVAAVNEAQTKAKKRKFEEAMEVIVNLKGIDLKKGGKQLNVDVNLPHASGEATKVCIIGAGNFAFRAREAGASTVLEAEDIERLVDRTVEEFGGVDHLVTNAGGPPSGPFLETTDEEWYEAFDLLVMSVVRLVREAAPHLADGGGTVVTVSLPLSEARDGGKVPS